MTLGVRPHADAMADVSSARPRGKDQDAARKSFATPGLLSQMLTTNGCNLLNAPWLSLGVRMNRWNIPSWLEREVLVRDTSCIYCGVDFSTPGNLRGDQPSWEHIVNDATITTVANIARCCMSCNASKGASSLAAWLGGDYCRRKGITASSIAKVASEALIRNAA